MCNLFCCFKWIKQGYVVIKAHFFPSTTGWLHSEEKLPITQCKKKNWRIKAYIWRLVGCSKTDYWSVTSIPHSRPTPDWHLSGCSRIVYWGRRDPTFFGWWNKFLIKIFSPPLYADVNFSIVNEWHKLSWDGCGPDSPWINKRLTYPSINILSRTYVVNILCYVRLAAYTTCTTALHQIAYLHTETDVKILVHSKFYSIIVASIQNVFFIFL